MIGAEERLISIGGRLATGIAEDACDISDLMWLSQRPVSAVLKKKNSPQLVSGIGLKVVERPEHIAQLLEVRLLAGRRIVIV